MSITTRHGKKGGKGGRKANRKVVLDFMAGYSDRKWALFEWMRSWRSFWEISSGYGRTAPFKTLVMETTALSPTASGVGRSTRYWITVSVLCGLW
jgi:hypothetical protein